MMKKRYLQMPLKYLLKGEDVALVDGDVTNIKITYPYDLKLANTILNDKND